MNRKAATDFDQELLDLYDDYAHDRIERRDFLDRARKFCVGGITAAALLQTLSPTYAWADQVPEDDQRIESQLLKYDSPEGAGQMQGYLVKPTDAKEKLPAVLVVHENRGLNPYIKDVVRRLGIAGFLAFGPDALFPLGGYPGNDDKGREMQRQRKDDEMLADFAAAATMLSKRTDTLDHVGVVGFCYGGGVCNALAVRLPEVIKAAVPFYGSQPSAADTAKIKGHLLIHNAELDKRIMGGAADYEKALKEASVDFTAHVYPNVNHGFHNDTTPRYDKEAAELAWKRTIDFFGKHLKA